MAYTNHNYWSPTPNTFMGMLTIATYISFTNDKNIFHSLKQIGKYLTSMIWVNHLLKATKVVIFQVTTHLPSQNHREEY